MARLTLRDIALGISGYAPKFARNFLAGTQGVADAAAAYVAAVRDGSFPGPENCY